MKRTILFLTTMFILCFITPVAAAPDTLQYHIASFVSALRANPYAYAKEPPALVVCDDQITAVLATYASPSTIYIPDSVKPYGCDIYMFHPPYIGGATATTPPAPKDLSFAANYSLHSITAVGFDLKRKVGTLDTMTMPKLYWPTDPFLDVRLDEQGRLTSWITTETAKIKALRSVDAQNSQERADYAVICAANNGWTIYTVKDIQ